MKEMWNQRFGIEEYVYGVEPNIFFKKFIDNSESKGNLLLPAEGEGRNAVYAAKHGWTVEAFDYSEKAMSKAIKLAELNNVKITYRLQDYNGLTLKENHFDVIGLFYTHMSPDIIPSVISKIYKALKSNGKIVLEGFSKNQLKYNSGGPKNINFLYSEKELRKYFASFRIEYLEEKVVELNEGKFHDGKASVCRMIAVKIPNGR